VSAFDRGAEARSEPCLLHENRPRLPGYCSIELGSTDPTEIDECLAETLTSLGLGSERVVDVGPVDRTLCDEDRPQQRSIAADFVHVLPPVMSSRGPALRAPGGTLKMMGRERKWNPSIK
jgi:hypothetical protein